MIPKHHYHDTLSYFIEYEGRKDHATEESHHFSKVYPGVGNPYWEWDVGGYTLRSIVTTDGKVAEEMVYNVNDNALRLELRILYKYDSSGRMIFEREYDYRSGWFDVFQSNSTKFGPSFEKTDVWMKTIDYRYDGRRVMMEYRKNGDLTGTKSIDLNNRNQPEKIVSRSIDGKKLGEDIIMYDGSGKIVEMNLAWLEGLNEYGETVDFVDPCIQKVTYNADGLPSKVSITYRYGQSETWTYRYYR